MQPFKSKDQSGFGSQNNRIINEIYSYTMFHVFDLSLTKYTKDMQNGCGRTTEKKNTDQYNPYKQRSLDGTDMIGSIISIIEFLFNRIKF